MTLIIDAHGQNLHFEKPPERVVSLIPSITESLFELGLGDRIAGISKYCIYPEDRVRDKTKVGGQKNPDFEKISKLNPDLIILNEEENKPEHIALFKKNYRTFVTFPRIFVEARELLDQLGLIFYIPDRAKVFSEQIRLDHSRLTALSPTRLRALYLIWRNPWMTVNRDTFIHDILSLVGLDNVFANQTPRYFEVTREMILNAQPDVIILPDEPYRFLKKHIADFDGLDIPAVKNCNIFLTDGTYYCWYGTRTARAIEYIDQNIIHRIVTC